MNEHWQAIAWRSGVRSRYPACLACLATRIYGHKPVQKFRHVEGTVSYYPTTCVSYCTVPAYLCKSTLTLEVSIALI